MLNQYHSFQSYNYPDHFIRHFDWLGVLTTVSKEIDMKDTTFKIVSGLAAPDHPQAISFESINYPGEYLRHYDFRIHLKAKEDTDIFRADATFWLEAGNVAPTDKDWVSFRSFNYPSRFLRHRDFKLWIEAADNAEYAQDYLFKKDTTFRIVKPNWTG
ncbi:MAG: AbfB domain-containing protein [Chloroflexota bacterium]